MVLSCFGVEAAGKTKQTKQKQKTRTFSNPSSAGIDSLSSAREAELLRDALRGACRAAERDLMQTASQKHWTDGSLGGW